MTEPRDERSQPAEFAAVFARLKAILEPYAGPYEVTDNGPGKYGLGSAPGPATIRAWRGKTRMQLLPVAWVEIGKSYVSYHLMAIQGNPALAASMSKALSARMQGKSCFNFKADDPVLFKELEEVTAKGLAAFRKAGYV